MCGIAGYVGNKAAQPILLKALKKLEYRGYDSVGCATLSKNGDISLKKDIGKVDEVSSRLNFNEMTGNRGIVQLRWATFGAPSQENSQPHLDSKGLMVGAHNGNVVNNLELRQQFIDEGMIDIIGTDLHNTRYLEAVKKSRFEKSLEKLLNSGKIRNKELLG